MGGGAGLGSGEVQGESTVGVRVKEAEYFPGAFITFMIKVNYDPCSCPRSPLAIYLVPSVPCMAPSCSVLRFQVSISSYSVLPVGPGWCSLPPVLYPVFRPPIQR